jgi:hypothetical protein
MFFFPEFTELAPSQRQRAPCREVSGRGAWRTGRAARAGAAARTETLQSSPAILSAGTKGSSQ